jgi:NTP pyrophosphatase (non-canonical NTP hydrolase)
MNKHAISVAGIYMNDLAKHIYQNNVKAGWWTDLETGEPLDRNVGELLCLVHSEISEAMEGHRKSLMDDKLPNRSMFEVELADVFIRIFDIAGKHNLDLGGAIEEKLEYNKNRADHKIENRKKDGGKSY